MIFPVLLLKFLIREIDDPLMIRNDNKTGGINVIDLANQNSCAFIATKDLGRLVKNNNIEFLELMGRYDHSDTRDIHQFVSDQLNDDINRRIDDLIGSITGNYMNNAHTTRGDNRGGDGMSSVASSVTGHHNLSGPSSIQLFDSLLLKPFLRQFFRQIAFT